MELLVNTIIFDYSSSFVQGDTVVRYPFYDILNLWFNAEGNSRSEFQISDNFNFLDLLLSSIMLNVNTSFFQSLDNQSRFLLIAGM